LLHGRALRLATYPISVGPLIILTAQPGVNRHDRSWNCRPHAAPRTSRPGMARETQILGESDIFLYVERREYLAALNRTCAGLESARVALAKAKQRLEG